MYRIVEIEHFIPHLVHKHPTLCRFMWLPEHSGLIPKYALL